MTTHTESSPPPARLVFVVGSAIGLAIVGDSFLYGNLPIEATNLGIALPLVGVLLSANRLVRLISNTWASTVFERLGPRIPFIAATIAALVTTAAYGVGWGFGVFLLARLGWGIAWSVLRQGGYQMVWTGAENARGRLTGLLWGMIRLGSALSVALGGYLRDLFGYQFAVSALVGVTALAIPVAALIRWPPAARGIAVPRRESSLQGWRTVLRMERGRRLLVAGLTDAAFEGVLVSTVALFVASRLGTKDLPLGVGAGTVAGLLLAVRWTTDLVFAPAVGALSDRLGQSRTILVLACVLMVCVLGVTQLSGAVALLSLVFLLISSGGLIITLTATANNVALHSERPHLFVGVYSTAHDAGSALGPLLAYLAGSVIDLSIVYIAIAVVLMIAVLQYSVISNQ
jgi:MFS family permease